MKKLLRVLIVVFMTGCLALAQAGGSSASGQDTSKDAGSAKAKKAKTSKAHKGGKASKKSSTSQSTK